MFSWHVLPVNRDIFPSTILLIRHLFRVCYSRPRSRNSNMKGVYLFTCGQYWKRVSSGHWLRGSDWTLQPLACEMSYNGSRFDRGRRTWVEEWRGGEARQQRSGGRPTHAQEVHFICGKCFIILITSTVSASRASSLHPQWKHTHM